MTSTLIKTVAFALLLSVVGRAQTTLSVSPEGVLTEGEAAVITITGATSNVVTIDNGEGEEVTIEIPVDDHGNGDASWIVPAGWEVAKFNIQGAGEVVRLVEPPSLAGRLGANT